MKQNSATDMVWLRFNTLNHSEVVETSLTSSWNVKAFTCCGLKVILRSSCQQKMAKINAPLLAFSQYLAPFQTWLKYRSKDKIFGSSFSFIVHGSTPTRNVKPLRICWQKVISRSNCKKIATPCRNKTFSRILYHFRGRGEGDATDLLCSSHLTSSWNYLLPRIFLYYFYLFHRPPLVEEQPDMFLFFFPPLQNFSDVCAILRFSRICHRSASTACQLVSQYV